MKFKATGIGDACTNFCFRSSWCIFYGIWIIPIYKKIGWSFCGAPADGMVI